MHLQANFFSKIFRPKGTHFILNACLCVFWGIFDVYCKSASRGAAGEDGSRGCTNSRRTPICRPGKGFIGSPELIYQAVGTKLKKSSLLCYLGANWTFSCLQVAFWRNFFPWIFQCKLTISVKLAVLSTFLCICKRIFFQKFFAQKGPISY